MTSAISTLPPTVPPPPLHTPLPQPPSTPAEQDKYSRLTVPSFPIEWAVALCTCNFIVPGLGTLMAGLTLCCPCSNRRGFDCRDTCCSACIQLGIALMQLLLTPVCLVGWIWSCVWGFAFIGQSGHERRRESTATGATSGGIVVVTASQQPSQAASMPGGSGYFNYAFHFKAPVAVHPYGPPPAYTTEAPPPPYYEITEPTTSTWGAGSASVAYATPTTSTVVQHQPRSAALEPSAPDI